MDFFPIIQQNYNLIAAGFLVSILVLLFFSNFLSFKPRSTRAAPRAGGAWPIIGHIKLLAGSSELPHLALGAMADVYGPIFTIQLGVQRALVVSSWEITKEIFTAHDVAVSSRPKYLATKHLTYDYAMFGFSPYGSYWREMRKMISIELLSSRRLELLKHVRVSEVESSIKDLYNLWTERKNGDGKVLVEMKKWFGELNFNVVLRMVAGKRYYGAVDPRDEAEVRRCRVVMRDFFHLLGLNVVADTLPFLGWLDLGGYEKAMKRTAKEMDLLVGGWLEEHRRKRDSGEATGDQDFMDVMLSTVESGGLDGYDADTITKSTCMDLIASSSDTTTVMLTWALSLLLNNRNVLKKAQDEIDIHIGKNRPVNESDITNLVYLQAIVKETLRLYPAGPLGGPREFAEDCIVGGYHVPKGTRLMVNMWKLHRDPQMWPNPSEFMPERFLTSHKDVDVKGLNFELIPFGAGRRYCPGLNLGLHMLHLVLATLLHSFEFSTPADVPVDMTETAGLTNLKATPLEVLLVPRLSTNIY